MHALVARRRYNVTSRPFTDSGLEVHDYLLLRRSSEIIAGVPKAFRVNILGLGCM
jgi:hypothetical protein